MFGLEGVIALAIVVGLLVLFAIAQVVDDHFEAVAKAERRERLADDARAEAAEWRRRKYGVDPVALLPRGACALLEDPRDPDAPARAALQYLERHPTTREARHG